MFSGKPEIQLFNSHPALSPPDFIINLLSPPSGQTDVVLELLIKYKPDTLFMLFIQNLI